jgi:hypothetical protein
LDVRKFIVELHGVWERFAEDRLVALDALAAIRNCVVHGSDAAWAAYRRVLEGVYGISSAPEPDEFLNATDNRAVSPYRYHSRLEGLAEVLERAIRVAS